MSEFRDFVAAAKINIGVDKEQQIIVDKGTVVRYDGTTAIIEGKEYTFPRLSSAIKARWLVDLNELGVASEDFTPQSAKITMRGATPEQESVVASDATFADEEREVNSLQNFRDGQHQSARGMSVAGQDGETVKGIKFKTTSNSSTRIDQLSSNAIQSIEEGGSSASKEAQFRELERQKMEREIEALRKQLAASNAKPVVREGIQFRTEGISERASDTTQAPGTDLPEGVWDGHGAEQVGRVSATEDVQDSFDVDNKEARLAMARQMIPNFDWDFGQHWKTKLKSLETNGNPLYVCAVYAVETDAMKKHIASQFPDLNLGA